MRWPLRKPLFIVAEMSCNHAGNLEIALEIIRQAHSSGADAIKFQTFNPDEMILDPDYTISDGKEWGNHNLLNLYRQAETPKKWHKDLFECAADVGLIAFSSPFSKRDVDFLEDLNCPIYKIASFEMIDLGLIAYVASTCRPMIISAGMASSEEKEETIAIARSNGCKDITMLHCVSSYPAACVQNLPGKMMRDDANYGLSDHSVGSEASVCAIKLGARVIEKHFMLPGTKTFDESFSLNPGEFKDFAKECRSAFDESASLIPSEFKDFAKECRSASVCISDVDDEIDAGSKYLRRSFYYALDLQPGAILKESDVKTARLALGVPANKINSIVGTVIKKGVKKNDPVIL